MMYTVVNVRLLLYIINIIIHVKLYRTNANNRYICIYYYRYIRNSRVCASVLHRGRELGLQRTLIPLHAHQSLPVPSRRHTLPAHVGTCHLTSVKIQRGPFPVYPRACTTYPLTIPPLSGSFRFYTQIQYTALYRRMKYTILWTRRQRQRGAADMDRDGIKLLYNIA